MFYKSSGSVVVVLMLCCATARGDEGTTGRIQPASDAPQPMSPEQSASKVRLPDGYRLELVANEPVVQDPSCIAFDERGRMFVCELHGYNIEGHLDVQELNKTGVLDKTVRRIRWEFQDGKIAREAAKLQRGVVKMLVDSDGDGVMDKANVWADDLPPCYGVLPAIGGIVVTCAPDIVFLADRDNDGTPEVRQTIFTGFRTDTIERGINNPRWGVDNWIYIGAGGAGGKITGPNLVAPVELGHSDFRIKPDGSAIEPVTGRAGTFGMTINDVGDRFPGTGGRPAMYALPMPYRYMVRNPYVATPETNYYAAPYNRGYRISDPHPWRVKRQQDPAWVKFYGATETNSNYFSGGCSNEYYGDPLLPKEVRGNIFYCEPSLNIVHRCVVSRDGAGYKGRRADDEQQSEFLASTDQWFRPMNLRVGPEGALYIVDMYREIIEDYSAIPRFLQQQYGLNKGGDFGRIWRLVPDDFETLPLSDCWQMSDKELANAVADKRMWRRKTAQRLLVERQSQTVRSELSALIRDPTNATGAIHAIYTLDGLGQLGVDDVINGLQHEHYAVRVHALRMSDRWLNTEHSLQATLAAMIPDDDPSVRLQFALTVGYLLDARRTGLLLKLARMEGSKKWMRAAILSSSRNGADKLLIELLREPKSLGNAQSLLRPLCATVAGDRNAASVSHVLSEITGFEETIQIECLSGLLDGLSVAGPELGKPPEFWYPEGFAAVVPLMKSNAPAVKDLALQLASKLPRVEASIVDEIYEVAAAQTLDETLGLDIRERAIRTLASAPFEIALPVSEKVLNIRQPAVLQTRMVEALAASTDAGVGSALLRNWSSHTPTIRLEILKAIGVRNNRLPALLQALEDGSVLPSELSDSLRAQLMDESGPHAARAKRILRQRNDQNEVRRRIARYRQALSIQPNEGHGELVFKKNCSACHKVAGQGSDVGPNLGTIINRPDETILMEILAPNDRIDSAYRSYIVTTIDGRTFTGLLASESPTSVALRQENGKSETILRREIETMRSSDVSLMPSNLHEQISPQDVVDLIAYLRKSLARN